jgi:hypothetical protein
MPNTSGAKAFSLAPYTLGANVLEGAPKAHPIKGDSWVGLWVSYPWLIVKI